MKSKTIAFLFFLLTACQPQIDSGGGERVRFHPTTFDALAADCPNLVGRSTGCTKRASDGSFDVYFVAPRNAEDERAMIPIGHEVYCHVFLKQPHRNPDGSPKDPSNDCKVPV